MVESLDPHAPGIGSTAKARLDRAWDARPGDAVKPALDPDVLSVEEAAEFLRVGRNQLYDALGRGEIPHRRIGRSIRLSRAVLLRWLEGAS